MWVLDILLLASSRCWECHQIVAKNIKPIYTYSSGDISIIYSDIVSENLLILLYTQRTLLIYRDNEAENYGDFFHIYTMDWTPEGMM